MTWLKEVKAPTAEKTTTKVWSGSSGARKPYTDYNQNWDPARALSEALVKVTWVYRCIDAIASNAARLPVVFREGDSWSGEPTEMEDLNKVLNKRSNPGEDSFMFRYRVSAQVLLSKYGAFIEVIKDRGDRVAELRLLPPDQVKPIPDAKTFVKGYEIKFLDADGRPQKKTLKPEQVIWIRKPHPFDPYAALTPLEAAGVSIETDWMAKMYNRNFLLNDGRPGGMVVIKGDVMEEDKEELQSRFRGSIAMAGRITVIGSSEGADFVDTAVTPRDAQYIEGRKNTKEEILMAFGVPEPVIGNSSGRTFDNAEMERLIFWMETMMPHLELVMRPLDVLDESDEIYVSFDLSRVDVLQRAEMKRKEYHLRELDGGGISVDEYRLATGRAEIGNGMGRVMVLGTTKAPWLTTDGEDLELPTVGAPVPEELEGPGNNPNGRTPTGDVEEEPEEEAPEREDDRTAPLANNPQKAEILPSVAGELDAQIKYLESLEIREKTVEIDGIQVDLSAIDGFKASISEQVEVLAEQIAVVTERFLERQKRVTDQKLRGRKMRAYIQKREKYLQDHGAVTAESPHHVSLKAAVETVFDQKVWDDQLREDMAPILESVVEKFGNDVANSLGVSFDMDSEAVKTLIATQVKRMISVNTETRTKIEEVLSAGALQSSDVGAMADSLEKEFDTMIEVRPDFIGLTEAVAAINSARQLVASEQTGAQKLWIALDENHAETDLQQVPVKELFTVGSSRLMYPGDPNASSSETAGCKCAVIYSNGLHVFL